jgi:hypothetical protein
MSRVFAQRVSVVAFVLSVAMATWSAWRYHELGGQIDAGRRALWKQIATPAGRTGDASGHVARAVHANEASFDHVVLLSTARRIALLVFLGSAAGAIGAALVVRTSRSSKAS